jgi:hypothetical protein
VKQKTGGSRFVDRRFFFFEFDFTMASHGFEDFGDSKVYTGMELLPSVIHQVSAVAFELVF